MAVGLEPVVFIVRAGPEYRQHGDPFTSSGTLIVTGERAFLGGVRADEIWPYREQFFDALKNLGVRVLEGHRIKDGKIRHAMVRIR
jgi:hypothetical protein